MNESQKVFVLGVAEIPTLIEQDFGEILIEPEEGYYRSTDLEPCLPYRSRSGMPAIYWLQEPNTLNKREVTNLAVVKGMVYSDEGTRVMRVYRVGDLQLTPQIPVIGHRIVMEYLQTFIEMSRCWYPHTEDKMLGTGNLYHRFHKFIKYEIMETYDRTKMAEVHEHLNEVTIEYMRGIMPVPGQDHVFGVFLSRIIQLCYSIIQPIADHLISHPWMEFELQRMRGNDFLLIEKGDFRINSWEAQHLKKTGL